MRRTIPFLTFQPSRGQRAAEAIALYTSLFEGDRVLSQTFWDPEALPEGLDPAHAEGALMLAEFEVAGQRMRASDTLIQHEWDLTPGVSLWLECDGEDEQKAVLAALGEGGQELMPLGDYGFGMFAWVQDRFGVTWQLALVGETSATDAEVSEDL